jgi:hypothetical protein
MLMEELFKKNFYPSEKRFYEILKDNGIKRTHKEVKDFINLQAVNQIHKPILNFVDKQKSINSIGENEQIQMDLIDYTKYKKSNRNNGWILLAIDVFTRKGYGVGIKSKSPVDVLTGFKKLKIKPFSIIHDDGKEFLGSLKSYLKENNINNFSINSKYHHSLGIIDRFTKTIKSIIEKNMTSRNSINWINYLDDIINIYNDSTHNGINGIKPNEVMKDENFKEISSINFWKAVKNNGITNKEQTFNVGDLVRVQTNKTILSKGYTNTYSKKVYIIAEVIDDGRLKLDNNKIVNKNDVLIVPTGSLSIGGNKQKEAEKQNKIKRRLRKEGLD